MCPQLEYEADTGVEVPPTGMTPVDERRVDCLVRSSLVHSVVTSIAQVLQILPQRFPHRRHNLGKRSI